MRQYGNAERHITMIRALHLSLRVHVGNYPTLLICLQEETLLDLVFSCSVGGQPSVAKGKAIDLHSYGELMQ